jgi:hypothetical protein
VSGNSRPIRKKADWFFETDGYAASPDGFVEFAKSNPVAFKKKIIAFLSPERARADWGEISAGTINNWVKAARLFPEMNHVQLD